MKRLLAVMALLPALWNGASAITPEEAFTSAPAEVFPLLDRNSRLDMLDYFHSGLDTPTANRLDGRSAVTGLSSGSLSVRLSDVSTAQLVVLPSRGDTIVAVVTTMNVPAKDRLPTGQPRVIARPSSSRMSRLCSRPLILTSRRGHSLSPILSPTSWPPRSTGRSRER